MRTVLTRLALAAGATLTALALAAAPAHAVEAAGVNAPTGLPATVTVKGATTKATLTVTAPGKVGRYHSAIILQPMGERLIQVGAAGSTNATFKVRVDLATKYLAGGWNELVIEDLATGKWGTVSVTALRKSRVRFEAQSMTHGQELTPGRVRVTALVRHWTPSGWKASNKSPVRWQVKSSAGWKTLGKTATTNRYGLTGSTLRVPSGLVQLRAVRLEGATVTGAVSAGQWVVVP